MRTFSSYGPVDADLHYYAPRKDLIDVALKQLTGGDSEQNGHYITVWAPRQSGKTWAMNNILFKLRADERFHVAKIELELFKTEKNIGIILAYIEEHLARALNKKASGADTTKKFQDIFLKSELDKPLILILDEFDALEEEAISAIVGVFRNIHNIRQSQAHKKSDEKDYLLHSVALIGVRSVLGVENAKGSPFNVQRSFHIPNLTFDEVAAMFRWHEKESGQRVDQDVIQRLFDETKGQPGLTSWFGELLTEGWDQFRVTPDMPMDMALFKKSYAAAEAILPNNNILNIISKARQEPYKQTVLDMFKTDEKIFFKYDDAHLNFLYMNGVIDCDYSEENKFYAKFPSPFIQKRLFNHFARDIAGNIGRLYDPFDDIEDAVTADHLNIRNIIKRYNAYFLKNRELALKNAPRRTDLRVFEAVFHFNLYMYLSRFIARFGGEVYPEFPTGNGKIDLIIRHGGKIYGIELKSYTDKPMYLKALKQAASYGKQLSLKEISLVFFAEAIDDKNRETLEADYRDPESGVTVMPVFVATGE